MGPVLVSVRRMAGSSLLRCMEQRKCRTCTCSTPLQWRRSRVFNCPLSSHLVLTGGSFHLGRSNQSKLNQQIATKMPLYLSHLRLRLHSSWKHIVLCTEGVTCCSSNEYGDHRIQLQA